jgi:hypothetical protein
LSKVRTAHKPAKPSAPSPIEPILCSVRDAAEALSITPWTVRQAIAHGKIEARKIGKRTLPVIASVRAYSAGLPRAKLAKVRSVRTRASAG